jgi:hypothetical protein
VAESAPVCAAHLISSEPLSSPSHAENARQDQIEKADGLPDGLLQPVSHFNLRRMISFCIDNSNGSAAERAISS